jgi:hypothetical protein
MARQDPTDAASVPMREYRWAVVATAALVLVQAVLAGRGWFVDLALIEIHGWVGNATFLTAIGQAALAFAGWRRGTLGRAEVVLGGLLVALVVAQIGLGYSGRESAGAASWHVPNGVLIFGVSAASLALALAGRRGQV